MTELAPPEDAPEICRTILSQTLHLRRGENLVVESWSHMLPWANLLVLEARKLGIRTTLLYEDEATYWRSVEESKAADLGRMPDPELGAIAKADGYVFFWGPEDRPRRAALPPEQGQALTAYNGAWYEAATKSRLRGCRIELGRATPAAARFFGVNPVTWQANVLAGSRADMKGIARDAARVASRLRKGKQLRVTHANGTDVSVRLLGRKPTVDDGIVDADDVRTGNNMTTFPGGATYVALDESFIEGKVVANRAICSPRMGCLAGGRWSFEQNRLASYSYEAGGERFAEMYDAAGTGKDKPGFLSVGFNSALREVPELEEFERGTILIGVGSNTSFGGKNRSPFQSYLALAGGHLEVDGKALVADGEIL
ncbi:MAG: hypothetical protein L3J87_02855 [Thermoplasmata archaeon]|nr:hypothetical protein [Thermoplasmata archaeon]MCI4344548.1 hypothetical protein [Thermoplasmata archaeon]